MGHTRYASTRNVLLWSDQGIVFTVWISETFFANSWTGEYDTANETEYEYIQETFVGNILQCKKLNKSLWIYYMVDLLKIPILRDNNNAHAKFIWVGEDSTLYLLDFMNSLTLEQVLLWGNNTNTYTGNNV